ncbi:MAG: GNAT family protein [Bacteroidota bacterium]
MMNQEIPITLALETERLLIRAPQQGDAATLREAIAKSLEELRVWMPWAKSVPTLEDSVESCNNAVTAFSAGTDHRLHIFLKGTETLIGCSGMHDIDWAVPSVEIGYWLCTLYTGKGYMTEAVREITRYAAEELNMNRVEIRMSADNARSKAVPERLGFNHEGTLRNHARHMDGSLRDTCVFAWTR